MKKAAYIFISGLLVLGTSCSEKPQEEIPPFVAGPDTDTGMQNGFFEDFTEGSVDGAVWATCPQHQNANWKKFMGVFPLSAYAPEDGVLSLRAVAPAEAGQPDGNAPVCMGLQTMDYESGIVYYAFRYGEVTVRAKFTQTGEGAWPAIWLMPVDEKMTTWPEAGEIDIMEHYGAETHIEQALHYRKSDGTNSSKSAAVSSGLDLTDYNVYGVCKSQGKIEWTVNGAVTMTVTRTEVEADGGSWPYDDRDYYIIINQSCAPVESYGGSAWRAGWLPSIDNLPYQMDIDWVKVEEN